MQPGLLQALMNVLPGGMEGASSKVLQADGTVDFAGFLQSMLPALEQQMEGMPPEARASLMAEFQREIHHAQAVGEVNGPEARVLEAMLDPGAGKGDSGDSGGDTGGEPASVIEQLLAMLGDAQGPIPPGAVVSGLAKVDFGPEEPVTDIARQPAQELPASTGEVSAAGMPMAVGLPLPPLSDDPRLLAASASAPLAASGRVTMGGAVQVVLPKEGAGPDVRQAATPPAADRGAVPGFERWEPAEAMRMAQQVAEVPGLPVRDVEPSARPGELMARFEASPASSDNPSAMPPLLAADPSRPRTPQDLPFLERIPIPVHQPREFGEAVGQRVMLMLGQQMQGARIELNPVDLGPMEIHLHLRGNEANVHFGAAHALTREVIEAALPRLREMLADQGFTQVNVNVGQQQGQNAQGFNGQGGASGQGSGSPWSTGPGADAADTAARGIEYPVRSGGVDLFA
ncbi:flagellar hook-length control protein FliK [Thiofaba sp. EF100]|uniref:flagellar hook-length control protein FliK n=1 Tax=Thiofaba sp. EF100 TaxID=3121274 RepID=UPI0032215CC1